ncbi:hypothetical protein NE865_00553 [Phthorimaea operculella]|nr:hypothetical protein NE865_00553 [Phthorimaea operculella]
MKSLMAVLFICCIYPGFAKSYKNNLFKPCMPCDTQCIKQTSQQVFKKLVHGIPSSGIESSEPIHQPEISGHVDKFYYNFTDNTIAGFSKCDVNDVHVDVHANNFKLELLCTNMTLQGKYNVKGDLLTLKEVNEKGRYKIFCPKYKLGITTKLEKVKGDHGEHIMLLDDSTMTTYSHAEEKMTTHMENCNNNKDLGR